ncbi:MAG TPA: hypothetical protein VJ775_05995 [Sphingomicrobium sp.]|nr:hypothetical protein [Sphingomicrobium sp.]
MRRALSRLGLYAAPMAALIGVHELARLPANFWTFLLGAHLIAGAFAAWSACWAGAEL